MNTPITGRSFLEPIGSREELFYLGGSAQSTKESVMQSRVLCSSKESGLVGALQDRLTTQLPLERRSSFYGTDFGAGPPPLMNV
jgi:hypothetical protein